MRAGNFLVETLRKLKLIRIATFFSNKYFAAVRLFGKIRGINSVDSVYTKKYHEGGAKLTEPTAKLVVDILYEEFKPKSVVDLGCGPGIYLRFFENFGVKVKGYEGSMHAIETAVLDKTKIEHQDLTKPFAGKEKYDLVMSFEVGEHLPKTFSEVFVQNIIQFGDRISFTAAHVGQGGVDHVNEQPKSFWIALFEKNGYRYEPEVSSKIRARLKENKCVWWLQKNFMAFTNAASGTKGKESS